MAVLLFLAPQHKASRSARSVPSTLRLDFTVDDLAERTGAVEPTSQDQSWPEAPLPAPPPMPPQVLLKASSQGSQGAAAVHCPVLSESWVVSPIKSPAVARLSDSPSCGQLPP